MTSFIKNLFRPIPNYHKILITKNKKKLDKNPQKLKQTIQEKVLTSTFCPFLALFQPLFGLHVKSLSEYSAKIKTSFCYFEDKINDYYPSSMGSNPNFKTQIVIFMCKTQTSVLF